jgi:hypothetical protein
MTFASIQNRLGVQPVGTTVTCVNKSGTSVAIGDLIITSFIHAGAVVNPEQAANTGYVFNCIRKAVSTETGNTGYLGVVTGLMAGAGANGREVEVQFGGICRAKVLVTDTVGSGTLLGVSATAGVLSNEVSTSEYSVTLMDNAAVADGTALKRVYIPTEYSFNTTPVQNPVVYGSSRASQFIRDLAAGTDSLDILIMGDSNTGFATGGMWGYNAGFQNSLNLKGWTCYGTPIVPIMDDFTSNYNIDAWNCGIGNKTANGNCLNGNASGGSTPFASWTPGTASGLTYVRYGSTNPSTLYNQSWAYISSTSTGAYQDGAHGIALAAAHPLTNNTLTLWHRVRYGTFGSGSGKFQPNVRGELETAPFTVTQIARSGVVNTNAAVSFAVTEHSFTPRNTETQRCSPFGDGNSQSVGPIAIHSHSVYCKRKGWSVHAHGYYGGYTSTDIASQTTAAGSILQTQLQEIRERQRQTTGATGRVLMVCHSGINGNETSNAWTSAHQSIWNTYKTAWTALGYPLSDLAIVSFVGVPAYAIDSSASAIGSGNLVAVRAAANAMVISNPDMTVVDVKRLMPYEMATYGTGGGKSYYNSTLTVHLSGGYTSGAYPTGTKETSDGYTVVANSILDALYTAV